MKIYFWIKQKSSSFSSSGNVAPVDRKLYKDAHEYTYNCSQIIHNGDTIDWYLLGRQVLVVIIVYAVNLSGGTNEGIELWGLPKWIFDFFRFWSCYDPLNTTGWSAKLSSKCILPHAWLLQWLVWSIHALLYKCCWVHWYFTHIISFTVACLTTHSLLVEPNEEECTVIVFFWHRCILALTVLIFCIVVTMVSLIVGKTEVPTGVRVIIYCSSMVYISYKLYRLHSLQLLIWPPNEEDNEYDNERSMMYCVLWYKICARWIWCKFPRDLREVIF